jgi:hypothetical protein
MNNATNLAIAAILMAAILVVGATFSTTTTQLTAFAYSQKKKVGGIQDGGSKNGNTVTIEECKNRGSASGFDTAVNQECENLICTHPGENATCTEEGVVVVTPKPTSTSTITPTPTPQPGTGTLLIRKLCVTFQGFGCDPNFHFPIVVRGNNNPQPQPSTFDLTPDSSQLVTLGPGTYTITEGTSAGVPITATFSGNCMQSGLLSATGTISAGEDQTCTIHNLRLQPPCLPGDPICIPLRLPG